MPSPSHAGPTPRLVGALSLFYFFSFGSLGVYSPYFPVWLEAHGFRGVAMSGIAALVPAMSLVGPPLVGALSDARGVRGNLLAWACVLGCASMAMLCLAEAMGLAGLFLVVFLPALAFAVCRTPMILIADRIAFEYGGDYGRRRVWGSLGYLLGATAFSQLVPLRSWRWLPAGVGLLLFAAYLSSSHLPRASGAPPTPALRDARRLLAQPRFVAFLICSSLFAASHASCDLCASLWFRDLGASGNTIGLLWGTGVVAEIALMAYASRVVGSGRAELLLVLSYAGGALRWLLTALLPSPEWAILIQPLHAVSFGLVWLSSLQVVRRSSEAHTLGSAQGLFMAANAAGSVFGILAWGPVYAARGGASVFLLAAGVASAAAVAGYALLYRGANQPRTAQVDKAVSLR